MGDLETRSERSRRLGMGRPITRRDFIDGIAVTAAVAASAPVLGAIDPGEAAIAPQDRPDYYPPALTGMRGSHPELRGSPYGAARRHLADSRST
jgi:spermidine dehydrogenase